MIQPLLRQTENGWRFSMPKQLSDGSAIAATFEETLALTQMMAKHSPIATREQKNVHAPVGKG